MSVREYAMPLDPEWYSVDEPVDAYLARSGPKVPPTAGGDASAVPVAIDFGSSEAYFPNVVSKFRERKRGLNVVLAGRDAYLDAQSRASIKTPYDADVVASFDAVENVLDYTFSRLRVPCSASSDAGGGGALASPLLMTETLLTPSFSRSMMSELLFETYGAPSVAYGHDGLFSAYFNRVRTGLVVSSGHASTQILPVLNGRAILPHSRRINWGGSGASALLLKLVQLKYLDFPLRVSQQQATKMLHECTYVATDYDAEVEACATPRGLAERDVVVQFPHPTNADGSSNLILPDGRMERIEPTEDEKNAAAQRAHEAAERKRLAGLRLVEQAAKMRAEKLQQKEDLLVGWLALREHKGKEKKADWLARLDEEGFASEAALESSIKKTEDQLRRARARQAGEAPSEQAPEEEPTFPLVNVPDHSLDEEGVREKRKQRLLKAGYDARQRLKAEKAAEQAERRLAQEQDEAYRLAQPAQWSAALRAEYDAVIERIQDRRKHRTMLTDRKSLAAQMRMKSIANLAAETGSGKRKRGGDDDTFGANDDDWGVYKEIQGGDDSDEEEEELRTFETLEGKLLQYDPSFTQADTWAARRAARTRLTGTWLRGASLPQWEDLARRQLHPRAEAEAAARTSGAASTVSDVPTIDPHLAHQIHLNIERFRVPEVLFQPTIAGVDQAGLDELAAHILKQFDPAERAQMVTDIFLTGQHSLYPNLDERMRRSVQMTQPVDSRVRVRRAQHARFDPWRGMARFILHRPDEFRAASITSAMYAENGPDYWREHEYPLTRWP